MPPRPNIVYIVVHDLGRHLGCYGLPVASPHIDAFAKEGILFLNAFCNAPACSPSRACAMTGQYSHVNGVIGLAHTGWALAEEKKTVVDYLNEGGYATAHYGLSHDRHPLKNHYQIDSERNWEDRYNTPRAFRKALKFMKERSPNDAPFYMNIGLSDTHPSLWSLENPYTEHGPAVPPEQTYIPPYLPDTPGERDKMGKFQAAIRYLDTQFGHFVREADKLGMADNTVFILTVDHGASTGWNRDKIMCYDKSTEIALIVRLPGKAQAGRRVDDLMQNIDNAPTILDLAEQSIPGDMNGRSFKPLLDGKPYTPHQAIFTERNYHAVGIDDQGRGINHFDPMRSIRTPDFHYIRNYRPDANLRYPLPHQLPPNYTDADKSQLPREARPPEELFHLRTDPMEFFNLAEKPEFATVKQQLSTQLDRWMDDTDDFIVSTGSPPEPTGYFGFEDWQPLDNEDSGKRRGPLIPTPE